MSIFKTKNMENKILEKLCRFYEMPKEVYNKKRESQPKRMFFYILQNKLGYAINDIVKLTKEQYNFVHTQLSFVNNDLTDMQEKAVEYALADESFEEALYKAKVYLASINRISKSEIDGYAEFIAECMIWPEKRKCNLQENGNKTNI